MKAVEAVRSIVVPGMGVFVSLIVLSKILQVTAVVEKIFRDKVGLVEI